MALSDTKYASVSARISAIATELRMLGLTTEIQLPTLVIAGNQSSGKSSVVEAICDIPLPRQSGTCTRCPTELRLRKSDAPWRCRVLLKREFDDKGVKLNEIPPEEDLATITNKGEISSAVLKAQAILLNPIQAAGVASLSESALENLRSIAPEIDFTKNSIVLEVAGRDHPDLTIIDLPGIIQSHPRGQSYVDMIKEMIVSYLDQPHVIISKTITAMDDPENQAVNQEATTADPDGHRTIGIITKPDNVSKGDEGKWLQLASNKLPGHELSLGWYVVKNPDQKQLESHISFADARALEQDFFTSDEHWSKLNPERLGAANLREALSDILTKRIIDALPAMKHLASDELKKVSTKLEQIPKPLGSKLEFELQSMLRKLVDELQDEAQGKGSLCDLSFYQQINNLFNEFGTRLIRYLPSFKVNDSVIKAIEDNAKDPSSIPPVPLEEVQQLRRKYQGRELPGFSPYKAVEKLIEKFFSGWKEVIQVTVEKVKELMLGLIEQKVNGSFSRFSSCHRALMSVLLTHLDDTVKTCSERLGSIVEMECQEIFTRNDHYYLDAREKSMVKLKEALLGTFNAPPSTPQFEFNAPFSVPGAPFGSASAPLGSAPASSAPRTPTTISENQLMGYLLSYGIKCSGIKELFLTQQTPYDVELEMISACLAYFKVAFKRINDVVPMNIKKFLVKDFFQSDGRSLSEHAYLSLVAAENESVGGKRSRGLVDLLSEDTFVVHKRRKLQDSKARLEKAVRVLRDPLIGEE